MLVIYLAYAWTFSQSWRLDQAGHGNERILSSQKRDRPRLLPVFDHPYSIWLIDDIVEILLTFS